MRDWPMSRFRDAALAEKSDGVMLAVISGVGIFTLYSDGARGFACNDALLIRVDDEYFDG
jgi:hypothetical protein